jgi:hypothetical protein
VVEDVAKQNELVGTALRKNVAKLLASVSTAVQIGCNE